MLENISLHYIYDDLMPLRRQRGGVRVCNPLPQELQLLHKKALESYGALADLAVGSVEVTAVLEDPHDVANELTKLGVLLLVYLCLYSLEV